MTFPEKPTTTDLSNLPENQGFPAYNSSMAGGNTITNKDPRFAGQGTDSEATHDVVAGNLHSFGDAHDVPVLPGSKAPESGLGTDVKDSGYTPSALTWKEV
jgi:hypothetical protein